MKTTTKIILSVSLLLVAACLLDWIVTAAPPSGFSKSVIADRSTAVVAVNTSTGAMLTSQTFGTAGNGSLTFTGTGQTTSNLSMSPSTCVMSGTGSVGGVSIAGTYSYAANGPLNNGQPVYVTGSGTSALSVWNQSTSSTWTISGTSSVGNTPTNALSGGTGSLNGQVFSTVTGTAVSGGTATTGAAMVSSGASVPCASLALSCSTTGCLVSSSTATGTFPLPANVPITLPVNNVNALWVTGGSANTVGYLYWR